MLLLAQDVGGDWGLLGWVGFVGLFYFLSHLFSFPPGWGRKKVKKVCTNQTTPLSAVHGRLIRDSVGKLEVASARSQWVNILSLAKLTDDGMWLLWPCGRRPPSVNKEM